MLPFREVTPGMSPCSALTLDTCGASVYEALPGGSDSAETVVSAVGAALSVSVHGRLSSGNGFSDDMDYLHFWRR